MPLVFAPAVLIKFGGFQFVEPNAPQALVYGWILQIAFALVPFILGIIFKVSEPKLGGCKLSLITVNLGALFLWLSIFIRDYYETLHAIAYTLWVISFIPILIQTYKIVNHG